MQVIKKMEVFLVYLPKNQKKRYISKIKYLFCDIANKKLLKVLNDIKFDYVVNLGGYVDHSKNKKTFKSHYLGCKNLADYFLDKNLKSFYKWEVV